MQISCRLDNRLDCGGSSRGPQHAIITDVDGVPFCLECALSELSSGEIAASRCLSLLSDVGKALRYSSTGTQQTLPLSGGDSPSPSPSLLLWLFRDSLFLQTAVGILGGRLKPGPEGNREGEWNRGGREGGENGERGLRVPRGLGGDVRALREVGNLPGVATQGGVSNVWQQRREKLYHTAAGQSTKEQHGSRFALPLKRKRGVSAEGVSREGEPQMAVQQTEGRTAERPTALSQQPDPLAALLELFHGLFVSCLRAVVACPSSSSSGNVRDPQGVAGGRWGPVSVQQRGGKAGVGRETGGGTRGALTDGLEEEEVEEICGSALLSIFAELDGLLISLEEDRQQERQQQAKEQKVAAGCVQRQGQKGGREARAGRERGLDRLLALLADMLTVGGKAKRPGAPLTASRGVRDWTSFGGGKLRGGRSGVRELSGGWQDKQERQASDNLYAKKRGEVPTSSSSTNRTEWNSCWGPPSSLNDFLSWVEDVEAKTESGGCGVEGGAGSRLDGCSEGRSGFPFTRLVLEDPRCCEALREIGAAVGSSARGREMIARICRVLLMPPPVGLDPGTSTEVAAVGGVLQSCSSGLAALLAASPPHSPLATFLMGLYDCCARLRIPTVPLAPPQLHRAAVTSPPLQPKRGLRGPSVLVQEETAPMSDGPRSRSRGAAPKGRPAQPQGRPKGLGQQSRSRKDPKRVLDFFDSESEEEEEDGEEERENENVEMINRTQQHMQTMDQGEKRKDGRFGEEEADLERQEREGQGDREAGKERQQEGQPLLLGCLCPVEILSTLAEALPALFVALPSSVSLAPSSDCEKKTSGVSTERGRERNPPLVYHRQQDQIEKEMLGRRDRSSAGAEDKMERLKLQALHLVERLFDIHQDAASEVFLGTRSLSEWMVEALRCAHSSRLQVAVLRCLAVYFAPSLHFQRGAGSSAFEVAKALLLTALPSEDEEVCLGEPAAAEEEEEVSERREVVCWAASLCATAVAAPSVCLGSSSFLMPSETVPRDLFFSVLLSETLVLLDPPGPDSSGESFRWDLRGDVTGACRGLLEGGAGCLSEDVRNLVEATGGLLEKNRDGESTRASERGVRGDSGRFVEASVLLNLSLQSLRGFLLSEDTADKAPPGHQKGAKSGRGRGGGVGSRLVSLGASKGFGGGGPSAAETAKDRQRETEKGRRLESLGRAALSCSRLSEVSRTVVSLPCGDESPLIPLGSNEGGRGEDTYSSRLPKSPPSSPSEMLLSSVVGLSSLVSRLLSRDLEGGAERHNGIPGPMDAAVCVLGAVAAESLCLTMAGALVCLGREGGEGFSVTPWLWGVRQCGEVAMQARMGLQSLVEGGMKETFWKGMVEEMGERLEKAEAEMDDALVISGSLFSVLESQCFGDPLEWNQGGRWLGGEGISEEKEDRAAVIRRVLVWWGKQARRNSGGGKASKENGFIRFLCGEAGEGGGMVESGGEGEEDFSLNFVCTALADSSRELPLPLFALRGDADTESLLPHAVGVSALLLCLAALSGRPSDTRNGQLVPVEGDRTGGETEASQSQSLVVSSSESQTQSLDLTGLPVSNSQEEEVKQSIKKSRRRKEENKEDREAPPLFDPLPAQSRCTNDRSGSVCSLTVKDRFLSALCRSILPLPAWGGDSNPEGPGIAPMAAGGGLLEVVLRSAVVLEVLESAHPALMEMEKDGGEEREAVESQAAAGWGVPGGWKRRERDAEIVKERERERLAREQEKECVENVLMLSSALALLRLGKSVDSEEWEGLHMLMAGRGPSGLWEGGRERQKSEGGGGASPFLLVRFFSGFLSRQRDLLEILQERQAQRERQQEKMNKSRGGGDAEERGPADEFECPLEVSRHFVLLEARRLWGCLTERRRGVRGEEDTGVMPVSCCQIVSPLTMSLCGDPDSLDLLLDIALDLFGSADTEGEGGAVRNAERGQGQGVSSSMWEEVTGLVGLLFVAGSRLDGAERGGGTCARSSAVEFWKAVTEKEGFVESLRSLLRGMSDRALVGEREAVEESGGIASFSQTSNSLLPSSSGASQETETGTSTEGRHTFFSSNALGLEVLLGLFELLVEGGQRTGGGGERDGSRVGLGMRDKRNVWALEVVAALHQCAARVWTDRLTGVDPEGGPANGGTSGRKPPQKNESGASGCPFLFRQMVSTVRALAVSSLEGSGNDAVLRLLCASSWVPLLIASGVRSAFTDAEREVHRLKKESPPPDLPPARTRQTRPYLSTQSQSQSQRLGLCPSRPPDSFRQQLEVGATCNANTNTETGMERGVRRWEQKWRWWDVAAASGVELGLFVLQTSAERAGETVTGGGDVPTAFCCLALDPLCRDFASGGSATSGEDAAGRGDGISSSSSSSSCADLLFPAFSSRCPLLSGAFATFLGFVMHSHANTQMARAACMEAQAQRRGRPLNSAFLVDPLGPLSGSAAGAASFGCLESPVACGLCAVPSAVREVTENAAESAVVVGDLSEREKLLAEEDRQDLRESLSLKEILEAERKIRAAARRGFLSFVCVGLLSDAVPAEIREFLLFGASGMHTCLVQAFLVEPLVNLVGWERESQREKGEGGGKGASGGRVVRFWDRKEKERNGFGRTGRDRDTHKGGGREAGRGAMMSFEGSLTKSKLNLNAFFLKDEAIRGPLWLYLSSLLAASPEWLPLDSLLMPQVLEGLSLLPRADRGRGRKDGEETWREEDEEEEQGVDLMESAEGFRLQLLRLEGDLRSSHKQRHVAGRKGGPNLFSHNSLAGTVQNPNGHRRAKPVSVSQGLSHSKFDVPPAEGMQKRQQTEGFPYTVPQRTNRFLQNPPARQTEGGAREMDRQRGFYGPLNRPGLCAVEDRRGRYYAEEGGGDGRAVGQEGKEMFPEYCVKKPGGTEWGWGEKGAEMNKKGRDRRGLPSSSKNGMEMRISHDRWEGAREEEREGDDVARQEVRGGGEQNGRVLPERDESMPLSSAVLLGSEVCFQGKRMGAWTVSQTMKDDAGLTWALCCLRVGRQVEASCASLIRSLRESLG